MGRRGKEVNATSRALEFKKEGFYLHDQNVIMCKHCNVRVEWSRRDSCLKHIASGNHVSMKTKSQSTVQSSITNSFIHQQKAKEQKSEFIMDTTEMLLKANIPIEKMDNPAVRTWMGKYIKGASDLPSANQLRREYVPRCGEAVKQEIKSHLQGKPVVIFCDETTDRNGNCVFAVLVGTLQGNITQQLYLGSCTYLDAANSTNCVRAILDTVRDLDIRYENVCGICTDSAPYMILCSTTLKTVFGDQFIAFTCWCHKLNLIGEIWQATLRDLNTVVAKLKSIFRNARKLKREYKLHLSEKYPELLPNLYPIPVLTRWSSWFGSVEYLSEYLPAIKSFLTEKTNTLSAQGQSLLELLTPDFVNTVQIQAVYVRENCRVITQPIIELQCKTAPKAHLLLARLESVLTKCDLLSNGHFGEKAKTLLDAVSPKLKKEITVVLKTCGAKAHMKLKKYVDSTGANKLFEEIRVIKALGYLFNPTNILGRNSANHDVAKAHFKVLPFFNDFEGDLSFMYTAMCQKLQTAAEESNDTENVRVENVLLGMKVDAVFSCFATRCLQALWLPISNADSERYFSRYSLVVTDRRTTMKVENIVTSCMLQFGDID